jgi:tRNA wybutosine-synthesizing protein 2
VPFKQKLALLTGIEASLLPSSYQMVGTVLLLKLHKINAGEKRRVAKAILSLLPYVKTVCEIEKIESELRVPRVRKLAGNGTVTMHKEHGILYRLDASKIMFSKGNLFERRRLLDKVKKNEVIVDMFAGIGYFSLAVAERAARVYAIEKNPVAFAYLKENIRLNKKKNVCPLLGDNRRIDLNSVADRVIMGYFPNTEKFLPVAIRMLKGKGIIHYHNIYRKEELWDAPARHIKKAFNQASYRILEKRAVKSVSPNTCHVVLDIAVKRFK